MMSSIPSRASRCTRHMCRAVSQRRSQSTNASPLTKIILDNIKATGPLSVARYMQLCLTHPLYGYYAQGDVFGERGDFITSPEISQIFGELLAVWFITRWQAAGSPRECRLIELGPGRGTLMADILRTFSRFPLKVSEVILVENSEKMRALQKDKELGPVSWVDKVDEVPDSDLFTMVIAHEFFDALPINVFERTTEGFREVMIDNIRSTNPSKYPLRMVVSREPTALSTILPATSPRFASLPSGSRLEISSEAAKIARKIGDLLTHGGAGLYIDYGGNNHFASSFRAFRSHSVVDVFSDPGTADLTANVDFAYLREATKTPSLGPIPQSKFLLSLGLEPRLASLVKAATEDRKEDLRKSAARLIDPLGMGSQYKIMAIQAGQDEVYPF